MTRFLICGLGSIGRRHLRNLRALGEQDIVLLRSGKSTLPDDELAGLPVEHDIGTALERWHPQAAIVSNPTALHLNVAIPAAGEGCHLLIEKPVSHSMQRIEELREAVASGGGKVLVGFQFRFHPGLQRAKDLLDEGVIGRPLSAHAHWGEYLPGWHPWEDYRLAYSARADLGGGVVLTLCHPFDYLRWLLGEVEAVSAETATLGDLGLEVEDTAEVILSFRNGPLASVHLDYWQRPAAHWLEFIGTRGTLRWDNADGAVRWHNDRSPTWQTHPLPEGFERNAMFVEEMRHFLALVRGEEKESRCSLEDGLRALRLALGALASSAERCLIRFSEGAAS
jgi:predicted dehydrogenase